MNEYLGAD